MGLFSSAPATHFPVVAGRRLDDTDVRLPHDLPADATLLIVSFQDALDPLSDQWARLGDRLAAAHENRVAVWETPVLGKTFKHLGGLGTLGVRHQVEDDAERDRTVPLFTDVKALRKALRIKRDSVHAYLVSRDGRIAWTGDGDIDMDEITELEAAIDELLNAPVPSPSDHPDVDDDDPPAEDDEDPDAATDAPEADASAT